MSGERGRETFASKFGLLMTMVGVAVGLGNVWRFPYMVGKFGGALFVLCYVAMVLLVGVPALIAEWTLGRYTRRGTLGAFAKGGFPAGVPAGYFFYFVVICATAYYSNAVGWVGYHALSQAAHGLGLNLQASTILPPGSGFSVVSFTLQLLMTGLVICTCGYILLKGLRKGIEKISKWIVPGLLVILVILIVRSVTLPGASSGIAWYIGAFDMQALNASTLAAALGQAVFSLSLGGTFMVVYGSYLDEQVDIPTNAFLTAIGDLTAGLLAGLAIIPAVFAFGLEPGSGPGLIFSTLPRIFEQLPVGWLFGLLFFLGLFGAAYLSDVAAFEVLVAGLVDNSNINRRHAVLIMCAIVFLVALPPMVNLEIFVPWDLFFGSGMQTLGALLAVITTAWCINRSRVLREFCQDRPKLGYIALYWWLRLIVPLAILFVAVNWLLESVFQITLFR